MRRLAGFTGPMVLALSAAFAAQPAPASRTPAAIPASLVDVGAQAPAASQVATGPGSEATSDKRIFRVPRERFAELRFANRSIIVFRAALVPREPAERVEGARRALGRLADDGVTGPVTTRQILDGSVVTVSGQDVFVIVTDDLDVTSDENLAQLTERTVARVRLALAEAAEARHPVRLAWAAARAVAATGLLWLLFLVLVRAHRRVARGLVATAEARLAGSRVADAALHAPRILEITRGAVGLVAVAAAAVLAYAWLTFTMRQFPLTRPWGETLRGFFLRTVATLGWDALQALPGLFTVVLIIFATRFVIRMATPLFDAIEQGRFEVAGLSGPAAVPTRRLVKTLLWLFALVVAYPYLPGSHTEAFKGVSVLVGLVISLGSSGIVNQVMSGFMVTYSGSLRPGEYILVGGVEGTVTHLGVLSTTLKTKRNEDVTIPNALVIAGTTINYSRSAAEGVYATTAVTIGYDTPWRQVEALLLAAAARAPGVRRDRPPFVLQTNLGDFAVEYTLAVCPERPSDRVPMLAGLRAHIQDAFNEHGVQIMSPHYEADPEEMKVVPPDHPFAAPSTGPARLGRG